MNALRQYCGELANRFGAGWNRFWFLPSQPHTISLLRIATGLVALVWLISLSFDLQTLLGPRGWLPVSKVAAWRGGRGFSLLDYVQQPGTLWAVHGLAIVVVGLFTVGLFTRITAVLSAVTILSYLWRAPMLNGEMEDLLAMLLVYLCIGPCGAVWSVDRWRGRRTANVVDQAAAIPSSSSLTTISLRLIQVHLSAIYAMMALAKCRGAVWWTGEATWWMAASPEDRWLDMTWLADYPNLIAAWTLAILVVQIAFPILIWNRTARPLMLALAAAMWAGIWLLTGDTGFCLLMLTAHLAFVSPECLSACCGRSESAATQARPIGAAAATPVAAGR